MLLSLSDEGERWCSIVVRRSGCVTFAVGEWLANVLLVANM